MLFGSLLRLCENIDRAHGTLSAFSKSNDEDGIKARSFSAIMHYGTSSSTKITGSRFYTGVYNVPKVTACTVLAKASGF